MPYNSPSPGSRWISANWESLTETHRFQWVISDGDGLT